MVGLPTNGCLQLVGWAEYPKDTNNERIGLDAACSIMNAFPRDGDSMIMSDMGTMLLLRLYTYWRVGFLICWAIQCSIALYEPLLN